MSKIVTGVAIGVAAAALAVGGLGIANADDTVTPNASSSGSAGESGTPGWAADGQDGTGRPGGPGMGEEALTGETADKVTAAAQAELPNATIERVETDSDGVYEAHAIKADGTHVIVQIDENFQVTAVVEMPAPGEGRGPGMGPGGPGPGETLLEGDTADKVTAAAQAELPNATIERVETDSDGVYEAHAIKADGTHVVVKVDADFQVTGVEEMPAPGDGRGPGGHHGPGGTLPDGTLPDGTTPDATTGGTTSDTSTTASLTA
ncbi:MAG: hypothetical protein R2737_17610 [Candidatus Nanopelagicales bacterium]